MAKESMKAREVKRQKMVAKYAAKKAALKKASLADAEGNIDYEALTKLQKLPRNASRVRLHNRCEITGRPKGYMRQFGISRIQFREMASAGLIPGVKKASWYTGAAPPGNCPRCLFGVRPSESCAEKGIAGFK